MSDDERRAYALIHNKTTMDSGWDTELLNFEIGDIDIDMSVFGFGQVGVLNNENDNVVDDDYTPEPPEEPKAKCGDIYSLGRHRLMCGSSTIEKDVAKLMSGFRAKLLFTSPPYSDMREYEGGKNLEVSNVCKFIEAYKMYADYMAVNLGIQRKNNEIVQYWDEYIQTAKSVGLKLLAWNVWDKMKCGSVGQQKAMVPIRHEWVFCFGEKEIDLNLTWEKKKSSIYANGTTRTVRQKDGTVKRSTRGNTSNAFKKMESVVKIPEKDSLDSVTEQCSENGKIRQKHPATFPVFLPAEYILAFTDKYDAVIEPFGGSGTTIIACEQLNRACYCMELEPKYVDVIIDRWEEFTGDKAVLLSRTQAE